MNEWITEYCPICSSANHILMNNADAHAWECWFCFNRWWLDDLAKDSFIIAYDVTDEEANDMMINCDVNIIFVFGHAEKIHD